MKNILIAILLIASLALGAVAWRQANRAAQNRAELESVQKQLAEVQSQLKANAAAAEQAASVQRSSHAMQETLVKTSQFAKEKEKQAAELEQKLADAKTNSSNPLAGMAKMFKDPKMKEMIKTQQKAVMGPMIDKQYSALFQQLKMSPDDSAQLKTLLTDKMLASADKGMSMMDDSLTADQRADLTKEIKSQQDDYDAQIKSFLGDNYAAYESYQKTVPDRLTVNQFGDQLSGNLALTPDQQSQMVQAMSDARSNFKWTTDFSDQSKLPANGDYAAMFTEANLNQFTQEKQQFDTQFLTQAGKILTPDQLTQFQQFQESQRQMQLMGLKMAASMFGKKSQ